MGFSIHCTEGTVRCPRRKELLVQHTGGDSGCRREIVTGDSVTEVRVGRQYVPLVGVEAADELLEGGDLSHVGDSVGGSLRTVKKFCVIGKFNFFGSQARTWSSQEGAHLWWVRLATKSLVGALLGRIGFGGWRSQRGTAEDGDGIGPPTASFDEGRESGDSRIGVHPCDGFAGIGNGTGSPFGGAGTGTGGAIFKDEATVRFRGMQMVGEAGIGLSGVKGSGEDGSVGLMGKGAHDRFVTGLVVPADDPIDKVGRDVDTFEDGRTVLRDRCIHCVEGTGLEPVPSSQGIPLAVVAEFVVGFGERPRGVAVGEVESTLGVLNVVGDGGGIGEEFTACKAVPCGKHIFVQIVGLDVQAVGADHAEEGGGEIFEEGLGEGVVTVEVADDEVDGFALGESGEELVGVVMLLKDGDLSFGV